MSFGQVYHPSRIRRDNPGLELTVLVADEYLTGTLKYYFLFSRKNEIF
jgi:hypothetical protein